MKTKKWFVAVLAGLLAFSFASCKKTIYHSVSFESDGGTVIAAQQIVDGETAEKPADPEKEGFTFEGWYLGDKVYDFQTPVTADITLKAKWKAVEEPEPEPEDPEPVTYTVTFNSNGGSKVESVTVKEGEKVTKPEDPEKEGYDFVYWMLNNKEYDFETEVTKDLILKAYWTEHIIPEYKVTFQNENGFVIKKMTVLEGETVTKLPDAPEQPGLKFVCWMNKSSEFTTNTKVRNDLTIIAKYREYYNFTVTFNFDNGDDPATATVKEDDVIVASDVPADPEKTGYLFLGWTLNGSDFDFNTPVTSAITLKAKWVDENSVETYLVSFDSNGGTEVSAKHVLVDGKVSMPPMPTKKGHDFIGWYLDDEAYNFSSSVTSDITLVAHWELVKYTVTFDTKGGNEYEPVEVIKDFAVSEPRTPKKDGYLFTGWTLNGMNYNFASIVTGNITLVANWEKLEKSKFNITVTIDNSTPDYGEDVEVTYVIADGYLALNASEGFDYYRWYWANSDSYFTTGSSVLRNISSFIAGDYSITLKAGKYKDDGTEIRCSATVNISITE